MCGIGGVLRMGKKPITEESCSLLLVGNEHRGNDATGIALSMDDGTVHICKKDEPAWKFVQSKEYQAFMKEHLTPKTWGALLHTRAATQGSPRKNENNHPISLGLSCIVHNGCISNEDNLFRVLDVPKSCETDSDILRAYTDKYGITPKAIKEMNKIAGSAAGGVFDPRSPHKLLLFRSGSPMILASTEDYFMFASEKGTLYRALKPFVQRWHMFFQTERADTSFAPMADNTAWIIGEEGKEFHGEFKTLSYGYTEPNRNTYGGFSNRQERWDREKRQEEQKTGTVVTSAPTNVTSITTKPRVTASAKEDWKEAYCPKCSRYFAIPVNGDFKRYKCPKTKDGCGTILEAPPVSKVN